MNTCPTNAIAMDPNTGAKVVMDQLCIGCHLCTISCPFGTVWTLPENDKAAKCNLCGGDPACVTSCPTNAILYVDSSRVGDWFESWGQNLTGNYVTSEN
jgi:Fe-S-cluster-containing hydrogenase component 2